MLRCLRRRRLQLERSRRREKREKVRLAKQINRAWTAYDAMSSGYEKLGILSLITWRCHTAQDYADVADAVERMNALDARDSGARRASS